jgi:hypothetical protein
MKNWYKLFSTSNPVRAKLLKNELAAKGIESIILNKQDSSFRLGLCELHVLEQDQTLAQQILENEHTTE